MARIRMISVGSRGDLQPYLAILLELQRRGHQVSLIGSVNFQAVAEAMACRSFPCRATSPACCDRRRGWP